MPIGFPLNITLPSSGQVQWDSPLNEALQTLIDAVESSVTVDGIDIQSSLDFQGNYAVNLKGLKFTTNTDDGSARQLFWKTDGELYVRDGAGRSIQLTSSGSLNISLNGGIGGDYIGSSAQVVYGSSGATFTFTSSPGVYATMEHGDIKLHNGSTSTYVDIKTSPVLGSTYNLTLPSAVGTANSVVTLDATGSMASTPDPSVVSVTASNALINTRLNVPGATYHTGQTVFSGSIYRTQFTENLHWAAAAITQNSPTFQGSGWIFGTNSIISLPLNFEVGSRLVSITVGFTRQDNLTASLYEDRGPGSTSTIAQRYVSTGSTNTFFMGPGSTTSGTLPFMTSATSSLRLDVKANTNDLVFGPVIVVWDKPIGG